ncbi:CREB-regulated transcription coactivator 2 [Collichthys lucidus]|uniref:CREB-regulated transcription coactivator 2 n=1 Tax=Collichthys lucidus TaxID=240159 RepID=A0A4U5V501_COLLU|nr:CREB-regulated transcription coactivator 2 [Collichthys lucidus]
MLVEGRVSSSALLSPGREAAALQVSPADVPALEIKLGALVVLLSVTLLFGFAPLCIVRGAGSCCVDPGGVSLILGLGFADLRRRRLGLISCFAGGVFLATCLLDLLPDYLQGMNEAFRSAGITLQAQKLRLARSQGPYYSGSLPNVNQIGRNPQDFQCFRTLSHPSKRTCWTRANCSNPGTPRSIFTSPEQPSTPAHGVPSALNTGGSLPDLSSLHFPSPLPTPLDQDEPGYPGSSSLSGGSSTGNLASTLTQLGINAANAQGGNGNFHHHTQGLLASLQSTLSNPSLQSSLSNPNIQSSLSSHSFSNSLSSASLHSSLSNPSLQSSLSSSPSLQSSLSSQSLHSSLSNSSLQSVSSSNPSYSSGVGGSSSCSSSYPPLLSGQGQPPLSTSPRRRAQLSPLILPMGGEPRRHHSKQFSPTISPTLSSITQDALFNSLLDDPYLSLQLTGKSNQQFTADNQGDCLSLNHGGLSCGSTDKNQFPSNTHGPLDMQDPGDQQLLNNQNQNYSGGDGRLNVPNIILTGDSPPGLSKEIASALSHVPGFEMDPFSLDDPLRMDPLALDMLDGDLMLADPAVEDSFRSDRLKLKHAANNNHGFTLRRFEQISDIFRSSVDHVSSPVNT